MNERPIRCGRTRCSWRGYETDLNKVAGTIGGVTCTDHVCPTCGCDSYSFMTVGEIQAWEWKRRAQAQQKGPVS
ncbi:hypothetical protein [Delftia tsuruhatensis]|uniref:hypothetical protein n=1 Tax=Delftia tsuruhatensis TaxID=180282 RepID=UPI0030D1E3F5